MFLDGLAKVGRHMHGIDIPDSDIDALLVKGNGIPLALAHMTGLYSVLNEKVKESNRDGSNLQSYFDWKDVVQGISSLRSPTLTPLYGLHPPTSGSVIVHADC